MFKSCSNLALFLVFGTLSAAASGQFADGEFKPFEAVSIKPTALSMSVDRRVLYFAHFTCPYCRQVHSYLPDWGRQLPQSFEFELVPAIGLGEHMPMAVAYYVVVQLQPGRLTDYQDVLFQAFQDEGRSSTDPRVYYAAAKEIGISREQFKSMASAQSTRMFVERAQRLTAMYNIDEVPTVVLANTYKTGPGRVQNDRLAFVSVLNGLISNIYDERKQ